MLKIASVGSNRAFCFEIICELERFRGRDKIQNQFLVRSREIEANAIIKVKCEIGGANCCEGGEEIITNFIKCNFKVVI